MNGWKYYNHAAIPTTAPHEPANISCIADKSVWKLPGHPLFARWTSDFDCGYETQWWHVIKDTPLDVNSLKAKRRYEINKGKKNFIVKRIQPTQWVDALYRVTVAAYSQWPEKYRPQVEEARFRKEVSGWETAVVFAGFDREEGSLCGYGMLRESEHYARFVQLRVVPEAEKKAINAAMVAGILEYYAQRLEGDFYIDDGERAIRHETAFQDYLEKYFDFRKAYCHLKLAYRFPVGIGVKLLYPFRDKLNRNSKIGSLLYGVLKMEELSRS